MIVVAHPDDELLGIGATMHKLIHERHALTRVVILGEGITARSEVRDVEKYKDDLEKHKNNIKKAQALIGYHTVNTYDLPDNRFDSVNLLDIVKIIEKEKQTFEPDIIFTHHGGDLNIDHQRTFEAVMTACRPMDHESVKMIACFETPSATEWQSPFDPRSFVPNFLIEINEDNLAAKIKGMEVYEFEKRPYPHPRSPEALVILAQRWGVTIGRKYAEAFMLIRFVYS